MGPALAFLLIPLIGLRGIFWASFIPGSLALIILLFFVKERAGRRRGIKILINVRSVLQRRFVLLIFTIALFSVGAFNFSFIYLRASYQTG